MIADPARAKSIFLEAVAKHAPQDWDAYLSGVCGDDADLRHQVMILLQAHQQAGSFLDVPGVGKTIDMPAESPITETPGTAIGPYKLLEQIGEGGFGIVFLAEQTQPVRRKVALKVLKPGMDTRQVVARFEAERQALAIMDHPNIARVFDGGATPTGRPFFVMELVKGSPITTYCDENHLTPRQRLELFVSVCQAIQHAHQKGIIHRDLKPSNVLVSVHDTTPVVKVIDFGVAKALGQELSEKTLFTGFAQMIGTPLYMSPEQAGRSDLDIDTRSDIYSLGVLLYELLTGTTPLSKERFQKAAFDEIRRIIREEEPPKPSTRLSESTEVLPSIAANRSLEPKKLSGLVRGELDWIVMKALEKDRNRRYETANGFALDIQRYLADEPVQACPPSAGYRFRKFARRNRGPVLAAVLVLAALLVGIAGTTIGLLQARAERDKAVTAKEKERLALIEAEENLQTARDAVDQMYTRAAEEMAEMPQLEQIRRTLLEDALKFYRGFQKKKSDDPAILYESARSHRRVGEIYGLLGNLKESLDNHRQAVTMLTSLSPHYVNDVNYRDELARAHFHTAYALLNLLLLDEGDASMQQAISLWEPLTEEFPDRPSYLEDLARANIALSQGWWRSYDARGERYRNRGEQLLARLKQRFPDHAISSAFRLDMKGYGLWRFVDLPHDSASLLQLEKECRGQLAAAETENADHPDAPKYQLEVAAWVSRLGNVLAAQNRPEEVLQLGLRNLDITKRVATQHPDVPEFKRSLAWSHYGLAQWLYEAGRTDEALDHFRTAIALTNDLATEFPDHARTLMHLAEMIRGCPAPQLRDPKRALELVQRVNELGHSNWEDVALEQMDAGLYQESLKTCEKSSRAGRQTGVIGYVTAMAYWHLGRKAEARELARQVNLEFGVQPNKYWYHPEHRWRTREVASLMGLELDNLKAADPETVLRNGISIYRKLAEERPDDPGLFHELAARYSELRPLLRSSGRKDEADATLRTALAECSKTLEADPKLAEAWRSRAQLFIELRLWPEAAADFARANQLQEPADSWTGPLLFHSLLQRYVDDVPGYRRACERMLARFADSADPEISLHIAMALGCTPQPVVEPSRAVTFAERAVADNKTVWRAAYLGVACLRAEQFERAALTLQDSLAIDPNWNSPAVYAALAMAQHQQKDAEKAAATLTKARGAREGRIESMQIKGVGFWPGAWWDEVHVVYGELLYREAYAMIHGSQPPEDARWSVMRGRSLRLIERTDEARGAFERAFLLEPDNLGLRISALPELSQSEDFARGLAELRAFLVEHPDQSENGRFRLAQAHLQWAIRQGNADQNQSAEDALAQAAAFMPELDVFLRQPDRSAMLAFWRKLADESLTEDEFRMRLGHSFWELSDQLSKLGHFPEAEQALRRALETFEELAENDPKHLDYRMRVVRGYIQLLQFLWNMRREAEVVRLAHDAVDTLSKAARAHPNFATRDGLARFLFDLGNLQSQHAQNAEAIKNHTRAAAIWGELADEVPGESPYRMHRAHVLAYDLPALLAAGGRVAEAEAAYRQGIAAWEQLETLSRDPVHIAKYLRWGLWNAVGRLGNLLVSAKRVEDAERTWAEALKKWPDHVAARRNRAEYFIRLGLFKEAAAELARAYALEEPGSSSEFYRQALLRLYAGDVTFYGDACRRMLERFANSSNADAQNELAAALALAPEPVVEPSRAVAFAERAVAEHKWVWRVDYLGVAQYRAGQFERAKAALEESLAIDPNWRPQLVHSALALAEHGLGNTEQAAAELGKAQAARDRILEAVLAGGVGFWPPHWWEDLYAEMLFREASTLIHGSPPPEDPRLAVVRGRALDAIGRVDEAHADFARIFAIRPKDLLLRIHALPPISRAEDFARGLGELRAFLKDHPEQPEASRLALARAHLQWGAAQCNAGRRQEAETAFHQAIDVAPQNAQLFLERGDLWVGFGEFASAIGDYSKALEQAQGPDSRNAIYHQRGLAHSRLGHYPEALDDFAKVIELDPDNVMNRYWQALAHVAAGDLDGYKRACAAMIERFGQSDKPEIGHWVAWTAALAPAAVADLNVSITLAEMALARDPQNSSFANSVGAVLFRAGRFDEAVQRLSAVSTEWEKAAAKPTMYSAAYTRFFLAMAHHRLGHAEEGRQWLDKAVQQMNEETRNESIAWNRRATLQLFRREAEELLKK